MPVKHAAFKALRQNVKARARNSAVKVAMKKMAVEFRKALTANDKAKASDIASRFVKALDKAAQKNIIHANVAARKKSRLAAALRKISG